MLRIMSGLEWCSGRELELKRVSVKMFLSQNQTFFDGCDARTGVDGMDCIVAAATISKWWNEKHSKLWWLLWILTMLFYIPSDSYGLMREWSECECHTIYRMASILFIYGCHLHASLQLNILAVDRPLGYVCEKCFIFRDAMQTLSLPT